MGKGQKLLHSASGALTLMGSAMTIEDCGVRSMKEECQIQQYGRATVGLSRSRTGLEQRGMK